MTDGPSIPPPPPPAASSNFFTRLIGILTSPAAEWRKIDGESTTLVTLLITYAVILAAILPIALILGTLIQGETSGFGTLILIALVYYAFEIGVTVALAFIIDALAPTFGGTKNLTQAAKLAVYASTPLYLLGILGIFIISFLGYGGLAYVWVLAGVAWGGFLLFLGLPILMKVPADKVPGYVGVTVGAWAVLWVIAVLLAGAIARSLARSAAEAAYRAAVGARFGL